jgi:hypothetical protein
MNTLLRLPLTLLELTAREGLKVARGALRLVRPEAHPDDVRVRPIARDEVPRDPVAARTAADAEVRHPPRRRVPAPRTPAPSSNGPEAELLGDRPAHVSRDAAPVASFGPARDVRASVEVQPPWEGYDSDSAAEIVRRVRGADDATKAVVLLYEGHHKGRRTVLDAAHG